MIELWHFKKLKLDIYFIDEYIKLFIIICLIQYWTEAIPRFTVADIDSSVSALLQYVWAFFCKPIAQGLPQEMHFLFQHYSCFNNSVKEHKLYWLQSNKSLPGKDICRMGNLLFFRQLKSFQSIILLYTLWRFCSRFKQHLDLLLIDGNGWTPQKKKKQSSITGKGSQAGLVPAQLSSHLVCVYCSWLELLSNLQQFS